MKPAPFLELVRLLLAIALLSLAFGCGRQKPAPLRVGINPWPGYEFLYLAQEQGFFRDEGLEVRLLELSSLSDARRAYERGQLDAVCTTVTDVLQSRDDSPRSPQIVQVTDYSNGGDVILARPGITSVAGLRGGRVGVELASLGVYVLARGLEKSGLGLADVTLASMSQLSMGAAFRSGKLDAIVTYPPVSTLLLRDAKASAVFSSREIPGEVLDVIAVEAEIGRQRPGDVAKLLRAFHRAKAYAQQNPEPGYRIMAAREGLTPAEFAAALTSGVRLVSDAEQGGYFAPGGKLTPVIDACDRVLRESGQIHGPDRRADAFTAAFVQKGSMP